MDTRKFPHFQLELVVYLTHRIILENFVFYRLISDKDIFLHIKDYLPYKFCAKIYHLITTGTYED